MSVSEGRELLIRQIADEIPLGMTTAQRETWARRVLRALDRLEFEVIPRTTLEADRRILDAADSYFDRLEDLEHGVPWAAHRLQLAERHLLTLVRSRGLARRGASR